MLYRLTYGIQNIFRLWHKLIYGIQNIFIYLPIIWNDRDWDWVDMYELWAKKFERMERFRKKHAVTAYADKHRKQLMVCKNLCKRIAEDDYFLDCDFISKPIMDGNKLIGFTECDRECHHNIRYLCTHNKKYDRQYTDKMRKQDINYLCNMIQKYSMGWWD